MGIISGNALAVNDASGTGVFAWRIRRRHRAVSATGSGLESGVDRGPGNIDWVGQFQANGPTPVVFVGDSFSFIGAPKQSGAPAVSGTARCLAIDIVVDNSRPRRPRPITHRVLFGANGELSTAQTAPTDTSTPTIYPPKGLCAYWAESQAHTYYQRLFIHLRDYQRLGYVDSGTPGHYKRISKDVDARFEWRAHLDDSGDFPSVSDVRKVARMYVTSDSYWELQWMSIIESPGPWEVDRQAARKPVDAAFLAKFDASDGSACGHINDPAGSQKWPS